MSRDWMVIIILLATFALGAVTLWVLEQVEARFRWKIWPRTKKEKLQDLYPLFKEALDLDVQADDAVKAGDSVLSFRLIQDSVSLYDVIKTELADIGIPLEITNLQELPSLIRRVSRLVEHGNYDKVHELCALFTRVSTKGDDDPTLVNSVRVS